MINLSKRERKTNYSVDGYFKETMRAGPSTKPEKAPRMPKAPKQIHMSVLVHGFACLSC
jgi:SWI/SNF-related matrix-associated actin-dependent regulator of chromatin subfamily A member 5